MAQIQSLAWELQYAMDAATKLKKKKKKDKQHFQGQKPVKVRAEIKPRSTEL